jgi:hypothetical protein
MESHSRTNPPEFTLYLRTNDATISADSNTYTWLVDFSTIFPQRTNFTHMKVTHQMLTSLVDISNPSSESLFELQGLVGISGLPIAASTGQANCGFINLYTTVPGPRSTSYLTASLMAPPRSSMCNVPTGFQPISITLYAGGTTPTALLLGGNDLYALHILTFSPTSTY